MVPFQRIAFLLTVGLSSCKNQISEQSISAAQVEPLRRESRSTRGTASVYGCDSSSRRRDCVRLALQKPDDSKDRAAMLGEACRAGYSVACFFLEANPKTEAEETYYNRRLCAFGRRAACSKFASTINDNKLPHEQYWVNRVTRLLPEDSTSVEMIAHPGAKLTFLESEGEWAWVLVMSFETSIVRSEGDNEPTNVWENDVPVPARIPREALSDVEVPLRVPEVDNNTRDFYRFIYGTPQSSGIGLLLRCGPIQVLADFPEGVQQLRQVYEGIEVRGFTQEPIEWNWGTYTCWPRVTRFKSRWWPAPLPEVPDGQIALDSRETRNATRYIRAGHRLYQLWLDDQSGLQCAEVTFGPNEIHIHPPHGRGKARTEVTRYGRFSETGFATFDGSQRLVTDEEGKGYGALAPCESYMTLVRETESALEFLEDKDLFAYHPDDVSRWYKTKAACEKAIAERPRIRLLPGAQSTAMRFPVRLSHGC